MSTIFRLSIASLCLLAMLMFDVSQVSAQGRGGAGGGAGRGSGGDDGIGFGAASGGSKAKGATSKKFEELLESKTLDAFRGYKTAAIGDGWEIQGKYLHFNGSGGGDIITKETYQDFDLQFEFKVANGGNSGVMYRVSLGDKAPYMSGPEYQVLDDTKHKDGASDLTSTGALYALYAPDKESKKAKASGGRWYKAKIIVEGNKIKHYLSNKKVVEVEINSSDWNTKLGASKFKDWEKFAKNSSGHIAFQDHGDEVWYRNIRIKRLNVDAASNDEPAKLKVEDDEGSKNDGPRSSRNGSRRLPPGGGRSQSGGAKGGGGK
jgi:hypothetical protein